MCGIVAAFNHGENKEPVNEDITNQLEDQLNRGKEGFGIAFLNQHKNVCIERSTELVKTIVDLKLNKSRMILLHHRYPTSSENKVSQTHPILVSDGSLEYNYLVVHNGVIHNEDDLKEEHENELGFVYKTKRIKDKGYTTEKEEYNDSESLAIEAARFIEKQSNKIKAEGSAAFIAIQIDKKTNKAKNLFFARNSSNPLNMSKTRGKLRLSSEGEGDPIKEDTLYSCNLIDFKLTKRACIIDTWKVTPKSYTPVSPYPEWSKPGAISKANEANKEELANRYITTGKEEEKEEEEEEETIQDMAQDQMNEIQEKTEQECTNLMTECINSMVDDLFDEQEIKSERQIKRQYINEVIDEIEEKLIKVYESLGEAAAEIVLKAEIEKENIQSIEEYEESLST